MKVKIKSFMDHMGDIKKKLDDMTLIQTTIENINDNILANLTTDEVLEFEVGSKGFLVKKAYMIKTNFFGYGIPKLKYFPNKYFLCANGEIFEFTKYQELQHRINNK